MKVCPRCQKTTLFRGEARDIKLAACSQCRGIWLDVSTAARVYAAMHEVPPRGGGDVGGLPCAMCQRPMHAHKPSGTSIEIDSCREHGVWFDQTELGALVGLAAQRHGVKPPPFDLDAGATEGATGPALVASTTAAGAVKAVLTADLVAKRAAGHAGHEREILDAWLAMELTIHGSGLAIESAALGAEVVGTAIESGGELASGIAEAVADGGAIEAAGELASAAAEQGASVLEVVLGLLSGLFE